MPSLKSAVPFKEIYKKVLSFLMRTFWIEISIEFSIGLFLGINAGNSLLDNYFVFFLLLISSYALIRLLVFTPVQLLFTPLMFAIVKIRSYKVKLVVLNSFSFFCLSFFLVFLIFPYATINNLLIIIVLFSINLISSLIVCNLPFLRCLKVKEVSKGE